MCIPSQVMCDCYSEVFNGIHFSRTVPSKVFKKPPFYLFFTYLSALYCIWLAEISYPIFLAQNPNLYLSFWSFNEPSVSLIYDSKHSHLQEVWFLSRCLWKYHISFMYSENNNGPRTIPCGTPDKTGAHSEVSALTTARCVLLQRKESIHQSVFPPMP